MIALLLGCLADRALLSVPVRVDPVDARLAPAEGVDLTLTAATLTLADLRLEAPATTARGADWPTLVSTAHAHPGHDMAGTVAGELTGTWTLDLLAGPTVLGQAGCYEGAYETARLDILPPARLEGTAEVDGAAVAFAFEVQPDQQLTGIPFVAELSADAPPTAIVLEVDLAHALSFIDWATPDADGDGLLTTTDGDLAATVLFGVVSTPTWTLTLED